MFANPKFLSIQEFEGIHEVGACDRGGGDGLEELRLFLLKIESSRSRFFAMLVSFHFLGVVLRCWRNACGSVASGR